MEKYATKIIGSIAASALIKKRNFITVTGFPGLIQIRVLVSWNINILWHKDSVG